MEDKEKSPSSQLGNEQTEASSSNILEDQSVPKKENRSSSAEKMRLLKERMANLGAAIKTKETTPESKAPVQTVQTTKADDRCKEHPDEDLQFYCLTNDQTLCSQCLLSGAFANKEVIHLKKAVEKLKPKMEELLQEVIKKVELLDKWQEKLGEKKKELSDFVSNNKNEIKEGFAKVRAALEKKEKELLESVENVTSELENEIDSKFQFLEENKKEIADTRDALETNLKNIKDMGLCQYYSTQGKTIQKLIDEKWNLSIQDFKKITFEVNLNEEYNLTKYGNQIAELLESMNKLKGIEQNSKVSQTSQVSQVLLFNNRARRTSDKGSPDMLSESVDQIVDNNPKPVQLFETSSYLQPRSKTPFIAFRSDIEALSPLGRTNKDVSPGGPQDTLRKLVDKIEEARKTSISTKDLVGSREMRSQNISKMSISDFQTLSVSKLSLLESPSQSITKFNQAEVHIGKEPTKNSWANYKDLLEENRKKNTNLVASSVTKLNDPFERNKITPKSYLQQDFGKPKLTTGLDSYVTPSRKDLFTSPSSQGLLSTKPSKNFGYDDISKKSSTTNLKLQFRRNDETFSSSKANRSFGSTSLTANLGKLKKQMDLWNDY